MSGLVGCGCLSLVAGALLLCHWPTSVQHEPKVPHKCHFTPVFCIIHPHICNLQSDESLTLTSSLGSSLPLSDLESDWPHAETRVTVKNGCFQSHLLPLYTKIYLDILFRGSKQLLATVDLLHLKEL